MQGSLDFRGKWTDLFANWILVALLTAVTLGIYYPWGYARMRRVILRNTYYQDKPLDFDGTGGELFGELLVVVLLTLVTLGLYAFLGFAAVRILKWDARHTLLPNGTRLEYRGTGLDLFAQWLVVSILSALTLGIYYFWGYVRIRRHILSNTFAAGRPLSFTGTGGQYLGVSLVNAALTLITLGLYAVLGFTAIRELKWECQNTLIPELGVTPQGAVGEPIQVTVNINRS